MLTNWIDCTFPPTCAGCDRTLRKSEEGLCDLCIDALPEWPKDYNPQVFADSIFGGRIPVAGLFVRSPFHAGSSIQAALHAIKYQNAKRLALRLGRNLADRWCDQILPETTVVPVPLHPKKQAQRGYNQSEEVGRGLAERLSIPLQSLLQRNVDTPTQTQLDRRARWENVSSAFQFCDDGHVKPGPVLLVDDTLTTGATVEACGQELLRAGFGPLQITALAYAS